MTGEYPQRDKEYIRWYPTNLAKMESVDVRFDEGSTSELAFYVHIPFCKSICKYCPFTKYIWKEEEAENYIQALIQEIELVTKDKNIRKRKITAGYLGGGTPTSLSEEQLIRLTDTIYKNLNFSEGSEFSIEANPDTVTEQKLKILHAWGYNRISFGVQSFDDTVLKKIGRTHQSGNAVEAILMAKEAGFDNIGIDLLYHIPGQSLSDWEEQLMKAIYCNVSHISAYNLFIPRGTVLHQELEDGKFVCNSEDVLEKSFYEETKRILKNYGYMQYTAYDFAKVGKECIHHKINWKAPQGEYRSFGAGAFSYQNDTIFCNYGSVSTYMNCLKNKMLPIGIGKKATLKEQMSRYLVLGAKYLKIAKAPFEKQFGQEIITVFPKEIDYAKALGWITETEEEYQLTPIGELYLGNISKLFFDQDSIGTTQPRAPMEE